MKKHFIMIAIIIMAVLLTSCGYNPNNFESSEVFVMNTYVSQKVYGANKSKAIKKVNDTLLEIESQLSLYIDDSYIDKINKNAGVGYVKVNTYTYDLIKTAINYSDQSQGIFDITIAPLTKLWGITSKHPKVPQPAEIEDAVALIDYHKILFNDSDKSIMLKEKGMALDLGGIAKGYICNQIKEIYDELKVSSALVSIGGNIYAHHAKPDNSLFMLGIRDPKGSENDFVGTLKVKDKVVATSGAYERFFEQGGVIYHHILDTKTGYPVNNDILSVTIVSDDGGLADFLSTTLYIADVKSIDKYINHDKFSVIVIDKSKNIYISDNIKDSFELTNDSYKLKEVN